MNGCLDEWTHGCMDGYMPEWWVGGLVGLEDTLFTKREVGERGDFCLIYGQGSSVAACISYLEPSVYTCLGVTVAVYTSVYGEIQIELPMWTPSSHSKRHHMGLVYLHL